MHLRKKGSLNKIKLSSWGKDEPRSDKLDIAAIVLIR